VSYEQTTDDIKKACRSFRAENPALGSLQSLSETLNVLSKNASHQSDFEGEEQEADQIDEGPSNILEP